MCMSYMHVLIYVYSIAIYDYTVYGDLEATYFNVGLQSLLIVNVPISTKG